MIIGLLLVIHQAELLLIWFWFETKHESGIDLYQSGCFCYTPSRATSHLVCFETKHESGIDLYQSGWLLIYTKQCYFSSGFVLKQNISLGIDLYQSGCFCYTPSRATSHLVCFETKHEFKSRHSLTYRERASSWWFFIEQEFWSCCTRFPLALPCFSRIVLVNEE